MHLCKSMNLDYRLITTFELPYQMSQGLHTDITYTHSLSVHKVILIFRLWIFTIGEFSISDIRYGQRNVVEDISLVFNLFKPCGMSICIYTYICFFFKFITISQRIIVSIIFQCIVHIINVSVIVQRFSRSKNFNYRLIL